MSRFTLALCAGTLALGLAFAMPAESRVSVPTVYQPSVVPVETCYQPVYYHGSHYGYRGCYPNYGRYSWYRHGHYHHHGRR